MSKEYLNASLAPEKRAKALLEEMEPFLRGGDMIEQVKEQETTFAPLFFLLTKNIKILTEFQKEYRMVLEK